MAAKVQQQLEKRLPELRDLEQRGVFSSSEIAEIVKRLTGHEGALVRQGTQARDVIDYVEYEQKLDKLRKMRVKRLKLATSPPALSDYALSRHILALYARGTRRFAASKPLWHHYIAYTLETVSAKATSAALTGAIAAHPQSAEFWVMAARWEADGSAERGGGNADGARKLLMRGLRFDNASVPLWLEWFRIELGFAERMRARWTKLGILTNESASRARDETVQMEADEDDAESESALAALGAEVAEKAAPAVDDQAAKRALVDGALVRVVLSNALSSCSDDSLPAKLLEVLKGLSPASTLRSSLLAEFATQLRSASSSIGAQVALATMPYYQLSSVSSLAEQVEGYASCASALQELIYASPNDAALREQAMRFLVDRHTSISQPELAAFLAGHISRQWRSAVKRNVGLVPLAKLCRQHLERARVAQDDERLREVLRVLDALDDNEPKTLAELEKTSDGRDATIEDHLALLQALATSGKAASVPVRLRRLQGRLRPEEARDLEMRWSSSS